MQTQTSGATCDDSDPSWELEDVVEVVKLDVGFGGHFDELGSGYLEKDGMLTIDEGECLDWNDTMESYVHQHMMTSG